MDVSYHSNNPMRFSVVHFDQAILQTGKQQRTPNTQSHIASQIAEPESEAKKMTQVSDRTTTLGMCVCVYLCVCMPHDAPCLCAYLHHILIL